MWDWRNLNVKSTFQTRPWTSSERWHVDSGPYRDAVSLPDWGPHGQRGWGYAADAVQKREARACTCGAGHLTGEHREAAQGKAAWTHIRTLSSMSFQINMTTSIILSRIFVGKTVESLAPLVVKMRASVSCSPLKITWKNNKKMKRWMKSCVLTVSHILVALTETSTPLALLWIPAQWLDLNHLTRHSQTALFPQENEGNET